eukprot:gene42260-3590_t
MPVEQKAAAGFCSGWAGGALVLRGSPASALRDSARNSPDNTVAPCSPVAEGYEQDTEEAEGGPTPALLLPGGRWPDAAECAGLSVSVSYAAFSGW